MALDRLTTPTSSHSAGKQPRKTCLASVGNDSWGHCYTLSSFSVRMINDLIIFCENDKWSPINYLIVFVRMLNEQCPMDGFHSKDQKARDRNEHKKGVSAIIYQ